MHLKHYSIEHDDTLNTNDPKQFGSLYHVSLHYGGLLLRVTNSRTGLVHTLDPGVYTLGIYAICVYTQDVYSLGLPSLHLELYILWVYTLVCLDWWNLHSGVYPIGLTILNLELYTHLTRIHYVRSRFWGVYILGIQIWTCKTMIYVCLDSVIPRATDFGSGCACIYMPLKRQCRGPLNSITFA